MQTGGGGQDIRKFCRCHMYMAHKTDPGAATGQLTVRPHRPDIPVVAASPANQINSCSSFTHTPPKNRKLHSFGIDSGVSVEALRTSGSRIRQEDLPYPSLPLNPIPTGQQ